MSQSFSVSRPLPLARSVYVDITLLITLLLFLPPTRASAATWTASPSLHATVPTGLFAFSGGPVNTIPAYFDYVHVYSQP